MKFIIKVVLLLIFGTMFLSSESIKTISDIKQSYKNIKSNLSKFRKIEKQIDDISSEGSVAEIYFDKANSIRFIKLKSYGELGKSEEEYCFHNGRLFFLYQAIYSYNAPIYVESQFDYNKSKIEHNRFYFIDGKLAQWIDNKSKIVPKNNPNFIKQEKKILEFVSKNLNFNKAIKQKSKSLNFNQLLQQKNGYIAQTFTTSNKEYIVSFKQIFKNGKEKLILYKFAKDGKLLGQSIFDKMFHNDLHYIKEGNNNTFIGCIESHSEGTIVAWIAKFQQNGKILWSKSIEKANPGYLSINSCIVNDNRGYIISGDSTISGIGKSFFWIKNLDKDGNIIWERQFKKSPQDKTLQVIKVDDGFIITGFRDNKESERKFWTMKIDKSGKKVWEKYL